MAAAPAATVAAVEKLPANVEEFEQCAYAEYPTAFTPDEELRLFWYTLLTLVVTKCGDPITDTWMKTAPQVYDGELRAEIGTARALAPGGITRTRAPVTGLTRRYFSSEVIAAKRAVVDYFGAFLENRYIFNEFVSMRTKYHIFNGVATIIGLTLQEQKLNTKNRYNPKYDSTAHTRQLIAHKSEVKRKMVEFLQKTGHPVPRDLMQMAYPEIHQRGRDAYRFNPMMSQTRTLL